MPACGWPCDDEEDSGRDPLTMLNDPSTMVHDEAERIAFQAIMNGGSIEDHEQKQDTNADDGDGYLVVDGLVSRLVGGQI